jgi:hypothetical protein
MDVQPLGAGIVTAVSQALDIARAPAGNAIVQSLAQGRQQAAAAGLSFARQSLETALTGANLITLIGGDGRSVLAQARDAMVSADQQIRTLRDGIVGDVAAGTTARAAALGELGGLGLVVQGLGTLAEAIINAPATTRLPRLDPARQRPVATMRAAFDDMTGALAAGDAMLAAPALDLTI